MIPDVDAAGQKENAVKALEGILDSAGLVFLDWQGQLRDVAEAVYAHTEAALAEKEAEIGEVIGWKPGEKTLLQAIKDEWHDFMMVLSHCSAIYDAASGGRISKPQTLPSEVIREMERRETEETTQEVEEETADLRAALAEREREVARLQHVIDDKYPAPPNEYLRRLQTDLHELTAERERLRGQLAHALVAWGRLCYPDADEFAGRTDFKTWQEIKALAPEAERGRGDA